MRFGRARSRTPNENVACCLGVGTKIFSRFWKDAGRDGSEPYRDFPLRPPIFLGTDIPLGSTTDAAGRLIFGMPVGTRPTRLRNNARYSGWPLLGLLSICGRNSS